MFNLPFSSNNTSPPTQDVTINQSDSRAILTQKEARQTKRNRRRRNMKNKSKSKIEPMDSVSKKQHDAPMTKSDLYFALDCEMVGIGPDGMDSAVARVTVINWEKQLVLDTFVKVPVPVTDYRTRVSGITQEDIESDSAMTFDDARTAVLNILRGKILIGHGLECDLCALGLTHPWSDVRDTARYSPYMREVVDYEAGKVVLRPRKLRDLVWEKFQKQIQTEDEPHSPLEDASAALDLYKDARADWESELSAQQARKFQQMEQRRAHQPPVPTSPYPTAPSHNIPYQVPFDPQMYNGPYGPQIPGFSPTPEAFSTVMEHPVVTPPPPPPAPMPSSSSSSWRWFGSRPKSPPQVRAKEEPAYQPPLPTRPTSPRSSGGFYLFRRNNPSKRGVPSSPSIETAATSTSDYSASAAWENHSGTASTESSPTATRNMEPWQAPEESLAIPYENRPQRSRLSSYLSNVSHESELEDTLELYPNEGYQDWQNAFQFGEWSYNREQQHHHQQPTFDSYNV